MRFVPSSLRRTLGSPQSIGKGRVDIGQGEVIFAGNLVDTPSQPLVPDRNVLDGDSMSGNSWFPPTNAFRTLNPLIQRHRCC